jgi:hypothetical protein
MLQKLFCVKKNVVGGYAETYFVTKSKAFPLQAYGAQRVL